MSAAQSPRRLERRDLDELVQLCREHARFERAPWSEYERSARLEALLLSSDEARCWVIDGEGQGELAGFASATLERSTWDAGRFLHLDCIYLRPPYRGAGLGRQLIAEVARAAVELGALNLQWQTPTWNAGAVRFYRRLGARAAGKLRFTLAPEQCAALISAGGWSAPAPAPEAERRIATFLVDSFTELRFRGNPAGVCLVDDELSPDGMLRIAQELNLSETAFVRAGEEPGAHAIRFFSPRMEIPLCGHATLAAAKVLFERLGLRAATFRNVDGLDLAVRASGSSGASIEMELPVYATEPAAAPAALLAALGLGSISNAVYNAETRILLLEIEDTAELAALAPDFPALYRSHDSIHGVLVTAPSRGDGFDFHSRYFWPWSGTDEDPVTGGTHTFLASYWSERLGKACMRSFQSSARSGSMEVERVGSKVRIRAQAVVVLEGALRLSAQDLAGR